MDWITLITELEEKAGKQKPRFLPPITQVQLDNIEKSLGMTVPEPLKELLCQTNGIKHVPYGYWEIWNDKWIIERNLEHREYQETSAVQKYFFFADNGCGEFFGHMDDSEEVGIYYPIEGEFCIIAPSFAAWVEGWYSGTILT